jgi:hypothetical protein
MYLIALLLLLARIPDEGPEIAQKAAEKRPEIVQKTPLCPWWMKQRILAGLPGCR